MAGILGMIANPAQADVLGAMDKGRERQANKMAGDILSKTMSGQIGALAKLDPDKAIALDKALGTDSKSRREAMIGDAIMATKLIDAGMPQEAAQIFSEKSQFLNGLGIDTSRYDLTSQGILNGDPEIIKNLTTFGRSMDPSANPQKYSQATNEDMKGWAFNESTGQYSLDPNYANFLQTDAAKLAQRDMLTAKEVVSVNDKVTALIKDSVGINKAANDLVALETSGTTSDQIAAVFKFMKAMDPSSTVRESELGLVYSAEGAAQGFANYVNSLIQGKKIDAEGFKKIVNTAKRLSNSAAQASIDETDKYTSVFADNITPKQLKLINERVPGLFDIEEVNPSGTREGATATNAQGQKIVFTNGQWVPM